MISADALAGGFADPVFDAQATFRAVLDALARPGRIVPVRMRATPPASLSPAAGAIIAALADESTPVFLDAALATEAVSGWIGFHTGAPATPDPARAAFAIIADPKAALPLSAFAAGTAEYPDRSTTIIVQLQSLTIGRTMRLTGPGIDGAATLMAEPLPGNFVEQMAANRALFPRGVDLILAGPDAIVGLPRSVRIEGAA